jgi:hypothetical protein
MSSEGGAAAIHAGCRAAEGDATKPGYICFAMMSMVARVAAVGGYTLLFCSTLLLGNGLISARRLSRRRRRTGLGGSLHRFAFNRSGWRLRRLTSARTISL